MGACRNASLWSCTENGLCPVVSLRSSHSPAITHTHTHTTSYITSITPHYQNSRTVPLCFLLSLSLSLPVSSGGDEHNGKTSPPLQPFLQTLALHDLSTCTRPGTARGPPPQQGCCRPPPWTPRHRSSALGVRTCATGSRACRRSGHREQNGPSPRSQSRPHTWPTPLSAAPFLGPPWRRLRSC